MLAGSLIVIKDLKVSAIKVRTCHYITRHFQRDMVLNDLENDEHNHMYPL